MRKVSSGFTLLEVMGAVVILGIVGVSLITSSMDSSHRARQARDRLGASLLADSTLAAIETHTKSGGLTPGTQRDETEDGYEIEIETQPANLAALAGGLGEPEDEDDSAGLLSASSRGPAVLTQIHVRVTDPSGGVAERVSFVFDASVSPELQALAPATETEQTQ